MLKNGCRQKRRDSVNCSFFINVPLQTIRHYGNWIKCFPNKDGCYTSVDQYPKLQKIFEIQVKYIFFDSFAYLKNVFLHESIAGNHLQK